jgi:pimeloyl-ACP methyl ester carboxylesterase
MTSGLLTVARDVGELASALGVEKFAVLGASGGGPFALAAGLEHPSGLAVVARGLNRSVLVCVEEFESSTRRAKHPTTLPTKKSEDRR